MDSNSKSLEFKEKHSHSLAAAWLMALAILVLLLMIWGATVRLTGSGLSIPEWPLIQGSLLPPFSEAGWQTLMEIYVEEAKRVEHYRFSPDVTLSEFRSMFWVEYLHRAFAGLVGIVFLAIAVLVFRNPILRKKADTNVIVLGILLITQAVMGGIVVKGAVGAALVGIHLTLALIFLGGIIWTALRLLDLEAMPGHSRSAGMKAVMFAWFTVLFLFLQAFFGALVSGTGAGQIINTFPKMAGFWFPNAELIAGFGGGSGFLEGFLLNKVVVQFIHRWLWMFLLAAYVITRTSVPKSIIQSRLKNVFVLADILFLFQIILGIGNIMAGSPAIMSLIHSSIAAILFGITVVILHDVRYSAVKHVR